MLSELVGEAWQFGLHVLRPTNGFRDWLRLGPGEFLFFHAERLASARGLRILTFCIGLVGSQHIAYTGSLSNIMAAPVPDIRNRRLLHEGGWQRAAS